MKAYLVAPLAAIVISASAFALTAAAASDDQMSGPAMMERMQHWAADREAVLDANLAGMKAGLKLTADQEKLWGPFEGTVRDAAKARMENMQKMMEMRQHGERLSPVDRLEAMADHMSQGAAELKKIADSAKPLFASLDETQKRSFGLLGRAMLMPGRAHGGMMMMMPGRGAGGMGPGGRDREDDDGGPNEQE
jgi:hypothetical protein